MLVVVATNWTKIGTFTDNASKQFTVEEANLQTNTIAVFTFEDQKKEFVLKSVAGPVVGERKTAVPPTVFWATNYWTPGFVFTNSLLYNSATITNLNIGTFQ